jgi:hypothetical protein
MGNNFGHGFIGFADFMLTVVPIGMGSGLLGWIVDPVNPVYPVKIHFSPWDGGSLTG